MEAQLPVTVSAFGDEIHPDLQIQLDVLETAEIFHLDLRSIDNTNILDLSDEERADVKESITDRGFEVPVIGSPIGKVNVTGGVEESATRAAVGQTVTSFEDHLTRFEKALSIADSFDAEYVRVFSYYIPDGDYPLDHRDEVVRRMQRKVDLAEDAGITLLHENVTDIYGESPGRFRDLLTTIDSPHFRAIFDPANFYKYGTDPYPDALLQLLEFIECVHIKDAMRTEDGTVEMVQLGQGDIDIPAILHTLLDRDFDGYFSLEPHLSLADPSEGLSGRDEFVRTTKSLERILHQWAAQP